MIALRAALLNRSQKAGLQHAKCRHVDDRMNRIALTLKRGLFFSAAGLLPLLAYGQIYTCKDAAGRTVTADHPMPE